MANALCNTMVLYRSPPRKKTIPVATPTADSNNTIGSVLNGGLWAK